MHKLQTFGIIKDFWDHQKLSRLGYPKTFRTIWKISSLSGNFPGYLETFEIIRKPSRLSGSFPDHPDTFQTIRKLSRPSGNFRGYPKIVHAIRKLYRLFGNLQDYTETSQTVRTLSGQSRNFPAYLETFQTIRKLPSAISMVTRKNFPDTQKLSGWQCHDAMMVFGPLGLPYPYDFFCEYSLDGVFLSQCVKISFDYCLL